MERVEMIYDILRSKGVKETDQGGNEGPDLCQ